MQCPEAPLLTPDPNLLDNNGHAGLDYAGKYEHYVSEAAMLLERFGATVTRLGVPKYRHPHALESHGVE